MSNIAPPLMNRTLLLGLPWLLSACAYTHGITPQEEAVRDQVAVDQYMPATREMRDNIETQELFAQAAFWSHEYDLNPSDLEATLKLASAVRKLGNPSRAVEITQTSRALHPRDPYLLAEHAAGLIASERALDAVPVIDQGLRIAPAYGRLWSLKGAALDQMEEYDAARQNYNRALQITPNDPNVLTNLGLSYALSGDLRSAERWLRQAAAMPGSGGSARQNLAMVLQLQGKTEEAAQQTRVGRLSQSDRRLPPEPVPAFTPRGTRADLSGGIPSQSVPTQGYPSQNRRTQPTYTAPVQGQYQRGYQGQTQPYGQRPQAPAPAQAQTQYSAQPFSNGMPATRLTTTNPNGQTFSSSRDAARQTAQSQSRTANTAPTAPSPFASSGMTAEQQSVLSNIQKSLQPGPVTPQGATQTAQQPYVVGPGIQTQAPQPQGQTFPQSQSYGYQIPQNNGLAGSAPQGRTPARRRR